ncbi:MAG: hypothetical protein ACTSRZ_21120, partial [Promethearchaeota archaeon]
YYFFPTFAQGKKVIWKNITSEGRRYLSYFPEKLIKNKNDTEMRIELLNGSIFQVIGTDDFDSIRGTNPIGCIFSEYAKQNPEAWTTIIEPILLENGGWAKFLYTPYGKNHGYKLYQMAKNNPNWFTMLLTVNDTRKDDGSYVIPPEEIEELRKQGISEEIIQQEYYCFTPDTDVICLDTVKFIKDVQVGDFVLTHSNRYRKVKRVSRRKYKGKLIKIKTIGNRKDIICTPEHRIRICNDGVHNEWVEARQLTLRDRVTFPRILRKKQKVISEDLVTLLAWYIAEGSCGKNAIQYTFHKDEIEYHNQILNSAERLNINYTISDNISNHTKTICLNNTELMQLLVKNCGSNAGNKKIPFDLIAGYENKVYEILINGDGYRKKTNDMYSTVSKTLAYQMQLLAHQLGYGAGILIRKEQNSIIQGRKVNCQTSYNINIYKKEQKRNNYGYYRKHKYNITVPIKSIDYIDYDGYVYNIEVMYDNSYTANGRVVHNCSFNRGIEGAFYAKQMETVREEGRIREIPLDSSVPVHTAWDIGTGDSTAIVFFQKLPAEYHIIDYYENQGEGVQHYAKVLQSKGYVYGNHYGPHDLKARQWSQDGKPQIEVAREYNVNFQLVPRTSIENRHEAVRNILSKCYFNEKSSGVLTLIEHLENYSKKYNKIMQEYTSTPVHDKHSHGADAFGYFALAEKSEEIYLPIRRNFIDRDYLLRHCDEYSGL